METSPTERQGSSGSNAFDLIPEQVFRLILSFVGPTSKSLMALSVANKKYHRILESVARDMLPQAQACFRHPFKSYGGESATSLFVRHARACSQVLEDLEHLNRVLSQNPIDLNADEILHALDMALDLTETGPMLSLPLERQVLYTCGRCGAKAFKYSKLFLSCRRFSADQSSKQNDLFFDENQTRLDRARYLMQMVVVRELQLFHDGQSTPSVRTSLIRDLSMRHNDVADCF